MPWSILTSVVTDWLREHVHWYSQWIMFCPFLTAAASKPGKEREDAESRILPKFLFSMLIQVTGMTVSVVVGSYVVLQIVAYRMDRAEEAIKTIQTRQFKNEDRISASETELAVIRERQRLAEREAERK